MTFSGIGPYFQAPGLSTYYATNPLTYEEQVFVQQLIALPLNLILDRDETENRCWVIGQQIYNKFKDANPSNRNAGKEAVERIFNAIPFYCTDGNMRKECIRNAWDEIGDNDWSWKAPRVL